MTTWKSRAVCAFMLLSSIAWATIPARAQDYGSLQGRVTDPSGGVVPKATVTLTDVATGDTRTTHSNSTGDYSFSQLPPHTYRVGVSAAGFKTFVQQKVVILVATPSRIDVQLQVGAVTQEVTVAGEAAPAINTQDATVGNVFEEDQIKELPFLARNVVNLLIGQPGVVFTGRSNTDLLSMGSINNLDQREGAVDGIRGNQTNVTVDGVDSNDWQNQAAFTSALPVTLDSVQEFRVVTTNANATSGLVGGAQVQLVTKSGTNQFHGNARWYYRTTGTAANGFFSNAVGIPRPKLQRNIGGGSLGGPIFKDRFFFFLDNEERRDATAASESRIVSTSTLRDGVLVYKCKTASQCPASNVAGLTGNHAIGAGFFGLGPSNIKSLDPAGQGINPAMVPYLKLFPAGNDPVQGLDRGLNFIGFRFNAPELTFNNTYIARFDYKITKNGRHTIFWRGSLEGLKTDLTAAQFPGESAASQLLNNSRGYVVQYQGQLKPTLVNTVRYGYTRLGVNQSGTQGDRFDVRSFDDVLNFGARLQSRTVPVHELNDDLSWAVGRHTLQAGGKVLFITNNRVSEGSSFPSFDINNGFCVALCNDVPNEIAANPGSFPAATNGTAITRAFMALTGSITEVDATFFANPSSGQILPLGTPDQRHFAERDYEGYVQDSWQVRSNLNIIYGIHYGYETPPWETNGFEVRPTIDIMQWLQARAVNANAGLPSDASPLLSWSLAGKANGGANSWYDPYHKDLAPRLSLAYSPGFSNGILHGIFGSGGESAIRLGAGMFYDRVGQAIAVDSDLNGSPGTATSLTNNSQGFTLATAPRFTGSCTATGCTGFPAVSSILAVPASAKFPFTAPANASGLGFAVDPHLRTPYSIHLTASFQRQLPKGVVVDVSYVGTLGRRLLGKIDYGQYLNIRDPKSGVDMFSAFRQLAQLANVTPTGGPTVDPGNIAQLKTIQSIPFFDNLLPNMPAFTAAFNGDNSFAGLTPTQAFYAFAVGNFAPSWSCALFAMDIVGLEGLPTPWNSTVDPQGDGFVLFQPQFQTLPGWSNFASSHYHSLQLSVRKTVGMAVFTGNYVFSKSIDNDSTAENGDLIPGSNGTFQGIIQNTFNPRLGRSLSDFNLRHNFNGNWLLTLPFGRGHRYGGHANRMVDALIGGWEYTGTVQWHSGFPFGPSNGFNFPTNFFLTSPGTITGSVHTSIVRDGVNGVPNLFADEPAAFQHFGFTLPGSAGSRNALTGPAYTGCDMGVYKSFTMPWSEQQRLQLRATAFNVFNNLNLNAFTTDPTSPGTFGNFTSAAGGNGGARQMEFAVRYSF
ncbi:MAG TPA: carboxypeptidase-like regulatory domain-containing protein [Candidatus Acidoferrales bacterium]|nr:carboxypeptidase-like regulatory domain-containing protein [Candidatus Acidoferrales bacterium]